MHLWQEPDRASVERRFAPLAAARSPHPGRSPGFGTTAVPLVVKESRGDAIMEFGNHALEHGPPCYWLRASVSTTRHPHPQPRQFDLPLRKVDLFNDVRTPPARTRAHWAFLGICTACVIAAAAGSVACAAGEVSPKSLADELPRIPPVEPGKALATFQLQHGFQLQLVAAEPLVASPVDACFDENGRMYVAEMRDYPFSWEPTKLNPRGGERRTPASSGCSKTPTVTASPIAAPSSRTS